MAITRIKDYIKEGGIILTPSQITEFSFYNEADNEVVKNILLYKYGMAHIVPFIYDTFDDVQDNIYNIFQEYKYKWERIWNTVAADYEFYDSQDNVVTTDQDVHSVGNSNGSATMGTKVVNETHDLTQKSHGDNTFDSQLTSTSYIDEQSNNSDHTQTNSGTNTNTNSATGDETLDKVVTEKGRKLPMQDLIQMEREIANYSLLEDIAATIRMQIAVNNYTLNMEEPIW